MDPTFLVPESFHGSLRLDTMLYCNRRLPFLHPSHEYNEPVNSFCHNDTASIRPPVMAPPAAELAIAKASLSAVLFRPDPSSCSRDEIEQFHGLLGETISRCSPTNVQVWHTQEYPLQAP